MECNEALKGQIQERLDRFEVRAAQDSDDHRHAAVALTVTDEAHGADLPGLDEHLEWQSRAALVLTRRSTKLRNHPGQWALPGGRIDPGETPEQAALREMAEEVNLQLEEDAVLGRLDDFVTRSGFVMTPIVVWAGPGQIFRENPDEVESIHRIPVTEFLREDAPRLNRIKASDAPVLRMPVGRTSIAAPTAAILFQFREVCLLDRDTRVAHFEQPRFAWR
jgi:8-oxo-dGTP pyrophosphatase MutT (NUDIX family)